MPKKTRSSSADERSIDIEDDYAMDFWTREFSVTHAKLKAAVEIVGTSETDVKRELKK